jgi:hypothetical protein
MYLTQSESLISFVSMYFSPIHFKPPASPTYSISSSQHLSPFPKSASSFIIQSAPLSRNIVVLGRENCDRSTFNFATRARNDGCEQHSSFHTQTSVSAVTAIWSLGARDMSRAKSALVESSILATGQLHHPPIISHDVDYQGLICGKWCNIIGR